MQRWTNARNIGFTILVWIAIVFIVAWTIGHFITAVILFVIAALLAYAISPGVTLLRRLHVPRLLAILIVYLVALAALGAILFYIGSTAIAQVVSFAKALPDLLRETKPNNPAPLFSLLKPLGLTASQYNQYRQDVIDQVTASAGTFASNAIPVVTGIASGLIDFVLVFILSVYLVIDGPRAINWLRSAAPASQRGRVLFYLDILSSKVGGYIRGQLIMSTFIGVMVGGGMAAFQVPFALLLGVLAFFMEFVPILGTIISGAACVLIALAAKNFLIAALVAGYFIVVHILEADVVGPRVVGRAVGLHPVVAILALTVGTELFGLWGAVFSVPIAGVLQALIISIWTEWRSTHPDQFTPPRPKNLEPQPVTAPQDQQPQEPVSSTPTTKAT